MKLSASILSIKNNIKENINVLSKTNIDYIHLDIMDNVFVPNKTWNIDEIKTLINGISKPLDVHLMVKDVNRYIDDYKSLKPDFITFHLEATKEPLKIIDNIKSNNIKVGMSIKPNTDISLLEPYLDLVDLILVMSVEPGFGGQIFMPSSINKIDELAKKRAYHNYHYLIEVDGGINEETMKRCANADILVIGSYITNNDNYNEQVNRIKNYF